MRKLLTGILTCLLWAQAFAQITVTTASENGAGLSLRQAIQNAPDGETILFHESLSSTPVELTEGEILVDKSLTIEGLGMEEFNSIQGNELSRLFQVAEGAQLTLRYLALSKGRESFGYGGGILNKGTLTMEDCEFSQCRASSGGAVSNEGSFSSTRTHFESNRVDSPAALELGGGAILNTGNTSLSYCQFTSNVGTGVLFGGGAIHSRDGRLDLFECTFRENEIEGTGGAVMNSAILEVNKSRFEYNESSDDGAAVFNAANLLGEPVEMRVRSSTFTFNRSNSDSGAIHLSRNSEAIIENSTIAHNSAQDAGGAIENAQGVLTISATTIANNVGVQRGGAIYNIGQTTLKNCILSNNRISFTENDLQLANFASAEYFSAGNNIIEEPGDSGINSDNGPALLLPLGNYGGTTQTMPPQLDSPALNAAVDSTFNSDQRGSTRFVDAFPDIGSVEFLGVANEPLFDSDLDGLTNGIEIVTGADPLVKDPGYFGHLRMTSIGGVPTLSFAYLRSTSTRYSLRILRSTDLIQEEEILSSVTTFIPNSSETPFLFTDESAPEGRAFYRIDVTRR